MGHKLFAYDKQWFVFNFLLIHFHHKLIHSFLWLSIHFSSLLLLFFYILSFVCSLFPINILVFYFRFKMQKNGGFFQLILLRTYKNAKFIIEFMNELNYISVLSRIRIYWSNFKSFFVFNHSRYEIIQLYIDHTHILLDLC